jgi:hypothetical protein
MARTLLLADELVLPTTTGTATSFGSATVVRLVNTGSGLATVYVAQTQSGSGIGSMTIPGNTVEYLEKQSSYVVYASSSDVRGSKVGFTG